MDGPGQLGRGKDWPGPFTLRAPAREAPVTAARVANPLEVSTVERVAGRKRGAKAWRPHLTAAEHQRIADLFRAMTKENGKPPPAGAIAARVGRSTTTVTASLVAARLVTRRPGRLTAAERTRIIELYSTRRDGGWLSCAEVAKQVGRGEETVFRVVRAAGVVRTRSEAAATPISAETYDRVLRLRQETGWSHDKIAADLQITPSVARRVLDESNARNRVGTPHARARLGADEAQLLVDLYRQGQSALEVAERTGRNDLLVRQLVDEAGIMRTSSETNSLARLRSAARLRLNSMDLRPWAERWLVGEEVEDLAAELSVPADLLWDQLANVLARCVGCRLACNRFCAEPGDVVASYRWTGTGYSRITGHLSAALANGVLEDGDVIMRAWLGGEVEVDEHSVAASRRAG